MFYDFAATIPANTPASTPVLLAIPLTYGIIHTVHVAFPDGCAELAHVRIFRGADQIFPTNPDGDFAWNDYTVEITQEEYGLLTVPYALEARLWNDDNAFPHTVTIRVGVKRPEPARPGSLINRLLRGAWGG